MKAQCLVVAILLAVAIRSEAQPGDGSAAREQMKKLAAWTGRWKGEGLMQSGPGGVGGKSTVDEVIEMKLDGLLLVVEGIGKAPDGAGKEKVVHHAFGILSYDEVAGSFKFRTYLTNGRGAETWFNVLSETSFEWGFDTPNGGKVKYAITLDNTRTKWNEIGQYSGDGKSWNKFFEMNLTRQP